MQLRHKRLKRFQWWGFARAGNTHPGWEVAVVSRRGRRRSRGEAVPPRVVSLRQRAVVGHEAPRWGRGLNYNEEMAQNSKGAKN